MICTTPLGAVTEVRIGIDSGEVIAGDPTPGFPAVTIDRGSADGLREIDHVTLPAAPAGVRLGACVGSIPNLVCIGLNYSDHAAESGMDFVLGTARFVAERTVEILTRQAVLYGDLVVGKYDLGKRDLGASINFFSIFFPRLNDGKPAAVPATARRAPACGSRTYCMPPV